jgi:very-short-patch-repair endonuclease
MKKAHADGRAWNIGKSRWNNRPSYPEEFFMAVIENEFADKNYIHEYPFKIYSLDFAWTHLKKCIEIDGEQHYRFEEYAERDKRKDRELEDEGWEVLRIRWKDMMNEPKKWIKIAKDFIEEDVEHLEDNLKKHKRELEEKEKEKKRIKKQKEINEINKCHEIALNVNQLIDSDIDFTTFGWVNKASKIVGISSQQTRKWIKRNYPKLLEEAFSRNN